MNTLSAFGCHGVMSGPSLEFCLNSTQQLLLQEGPSLKSKGKAGSATRVAVLTWRSLLIMSREWKYYWLRLILYMLLALCIGTVFSGLGHSLSSVGVSFIYRKNSSLFKYPDISNVQCDTSTFLFRPLLMKYVTKLCKG